MSEHPLISLVKLTKSFILNSGKVFALQEADLEIYQGETVAVMGPSGSGKSTLLNLLGCLDRPTSGTYSLTGLDVSRLSDKEQASIRGKKIGFIFQSFNLIAQFNVFENIALPFQYLIPALSKKEIKTRVLEAIEKVHLNNRLFHLPSQLSGGEMQRVAIARALAIQPILILADEPTGNLDSQTGEAILNLFSEFKSLGVTFIIVTHAKNVAAICSREIAMLDGKIISDSSREKR